MLQYIDLICFHSGGSDTLLSWSSQRDSETIDKYVFILATPPLHYALYNCIWEFRCLAPIFLGNNCFRVRYLDITFTFDIYLGTNWIVATTATARESIELLTGMWKDVFWIFGTSWMLCELAVLVNENIWEIFAPWRGRLCKKFFWRLLKGRVWVASVQNFNLHSPPSQVPHFWQKFDQNIPPLDLWAVLTKL